MGKHEMELEKIALESMGLGWVGLGRASCKGGTGMGERCPDRPPESPFGWTAYLFLFAEPKRPPPLGLACASTLAKPCGSGECSVICEQVETWCGLDKRFHT